MSENAHQTEIEEIHSKVKELLSLMEYRLGPPPNLSYLAAGYIGKDETIKYVSDILYDLTRMKAIIWYNTEHGVDDEYPHQPTFKHNPINPIRAEDLTVV